MGTKLLAIAAICLTGCPAWAAEDLDAPFTELGKLQEATVPAFRYKLFPQVARRQGYAGGVTTQGQLFRLRAESPDRIPGSGPMKFVEVKTTAKNGAIDIVAVSELTLRGMPEYPPDKPAATFKSELRNLRVSPDHEVRVRVRFKDGTDHFLLRFDVEKGLLLEPVSSVNGEVGEASIPDFVTLQDSDGGRAVYYCNPFTVWASDAGKLSWSTDIQMEGQPKSIKVLGDTLFVTTTAGHSFYVRNDTGELVFYDKSVLPGRDPFEEIFAMGREAMAKDGKFGQLQRYITAAVVLNDRRAVPFLIDCINEGFGLPEKAAAVAALEKFNGNPDLWEPKNRRPGEIHLHWVGSQRINTDGARAAEIARWRQVFRDVL